MKIYKTFLTVGLLLVGASANAASWLLCDSDPEKKIKISGNSTTAEISTWNPISELIASLRAASQKAGKPRNKVVSADPEKPFLPYEWELAVAPNIKMNERVPTAEEEAEQKSMLEGDDLED